MPDLNKDFIVKVRDAIAQAPESRFDMGYWLNDKEWWNDSQNPVHEVSCGTTGCLAGWAVLVDGIERGIPLHFDDRKCEIVEDRKTIWARAVELLGVDRDENNSSVLFTPDGWPEELYEFYMEDEKAAVLALLDGLLDGTVVYDEVGSHWVKV